MPITEFQIETVPWIKKSAEPLQFWPDKHTRAYRGPGGQADRRKRKARDAVPHPIPHDPFAFDSSEDDGGRWRRRARAQLGL